MSDTTAKNIGLIAPELQEFICQNGDLVDLILADVASEVKSDVFGSKQEQGQRYLAAHYLSLADSGASGGNSGASGPVEMEKVGDVQVKYGSSNLMDATRYDETKYGRLFMNVRKGCILNFNSYVP